MLTTFYDIFGCSCRSTHSLVHPWSRPPPNILLPSVVSFFYVRAHRFLDLNTNMTTIAFGCCYYYSFFFFCCSVWNTSVLPFTITSHRRNQSARMLGMWSRNNSRSHPKTTKPCPLVLGWAGKDPPEKGRLLECTLSRHSFGTHVICRVRGCVLC